MVCTISIGLRSAFPRAFVQVHAPFTVAVPQYSFLSSGEMAMHVYVRTSFDVVTWIGLTLRLTVSSVHLGMFMLVRGQSEIQSCPAL